MHKKYQKVLPMTIGVALLCSGFSVHAKPARPASNYSVGKPNLNCIYDSARYHNVPFQVLLAINSVEMGRTGQSVLNKNGSADNGAFQINTIHYPRAKRLAGATHYDISSKGCFNAEFAAMLLSEALNQPSKQNKDFFTRAAGYHSWTPKYNQIYRRKLIRYTNEWAEWLRSRGWQDSITPIREVL